MAHKIANPKGPYPKFTPEEFEKKVEEYFGMCDAQKRPYTITGLACALDTTRELMRRYDKNPAYHDTIRRAKAKIHNYAEESLWRSGISKGIIFNLKNNWGWEDRVHSTVQSTSLSDEQAKKILEETQKMNNDEYEE